MKSLGHPSNPYSTAKTETPNPEPQTVSLLPMTRISRLGGSGLGFRVGSLIYEVPNTTFSLLLRAQPQKPAKT